jgi:hypothetical protein
MNFKIAIIGSRKYTNEIKIKDLIFKLQQKYGAELEIVSGGQPLGADGFAKKYALFFNVRYVEFPPAHFEYNQWCGKEPFFYSKKYHVSNYFKRNKEIAEYADIVYAFIPAGLVSKGTESTIKFAMKANKKVVRSV